MAQWILCLHPYRKLYLLPARLAQSVEHETLNLRVVGSSPTLGDSYFKHDFNLNLLPIYDIRWNCSSIFLHPLLKTIG